jgi:small ligand-binding sensory domain FIST
MPFAAALSTTAATARAAEEVCAAVADGLGGKPDLAFLFFSADHAAAVDVLSQVVNDRLRPNCLLGCTAEAVVGNDREVEEGPALSLWVGRWTSGVTLDSFHLNLEATADGPSLLGWPDALNVAEPDESALLLLADPYTFPADAFLDRMNGDHAGLRVLGGMSSGIDGPGRCRLLLDGGVLDKGAVGVLLRGKLGLRALVSQGCRPVGRPFVITRADENVIQELGGRPPLLVLQELWQTLGPDEQRLFQKGLHVGRVINEYQAEFQRGDFLVRNVLGLDKGTGALALTDRVRVGQTVQFQVRDAASADEDLHALLQLDLNAHENKPAGALLFSCNGRGRRLFPEPDHDARAIRGEAGAIPLAGFFAQGELGPVGGQNFLHGFTASIALFED